MKFCLFRPAFYLSCILIVLHSKNNVFSFPEQELDLTDCFEYQLDESLNFSSNFMIFSKSNYSYLNINTNINILVKNQSTFQISNITLNYTCNLDINLVVFHIQDNSTLILTVIFEFKIIRNKTTIKIIIFDLLI